ncbi:MAG: hypothetical protein V4556_12530 [Bacteroidota bacterium]
MVGKDSFNFYGVFFVAALFCLHSCKRQVTINSLNIIEKKVLDSIPSGSGIVLINDTAYIIGDDATGVYRLNLKTYDQKKIPMAGLNFNQYREPKPVKHDFETASFASWNGNEYLLSFGSGSNATRDSMLMIKLADSNGNKIISLQNFYSRLQSATSTISKEWNIEGATVDKDMLILLNRGNNMIIQFKINDFLFYLLNDNMPFPAIEYHSIKLPAIQGHEARLSGACSLEDTHILFSASVEDTPDWTKDGPVLGSFIGIYSLRDSLVVASYLLKNEKDEVLKEKIESLDILQKESGKEIIVIAIGDNDNGTTNLFKLKLQLPMLKHFP